MTATVRASCLLTLLSIAVFLAGGCASTRPGEIIVDRGVYAAMWTRDSRTLYYYKEGTGVCRYDVDTGKRQTYHLRDAEGLDISAEGFDLSPDGKRVVYQRYEQGIYVADLATGRADQVLATGDGLRGLYWVTDDKIVFTRTARAAGVPEPLCMLDLSDQSVTKLRSDAVAVIRSTDGSGFIYKDRDDHYHHYLTSSGKDTMLKSDLMMRPHASVAFIFLSRCRTVYHIWGYADTDETITEVLDLSTMHVRRVRLPSSAQFMGLSPDMSRYWETGPYHQDTEPIKLYLMRITPETVRQLAESAR